MAVKTTLTMHEKDFKDLAQYLKRHEGDIAHEINDFGDLAETFYHVFGDYPEKD